MHRARRGSPPRAGNLQAGRGRRDIPIDLTTPSDSGSEARPAVRRSQRLSSDLDSENDMFVPLDRPYPREAQARARAPPRRQVLVIDSLSPDPEMRSQAARPQQSISSSPEFQAAEPIRPPPRRDLDGLWDSSSPSLSPEYEVDVDADLNRHQGAFEPPALNPQLAMNPGRNGQVEQRHIVGDYILDEEFDDGMIAELMEQFGEEAQVEYGLSAFHQDARRRAVNAPNLHAARPVESVVMETKPECIENVIALFPGICKDYVSQKYDTVSKSSDRLIAYILDKTEKGSDYPRAKRKQNSLKRKRELDDDEEAARKYGALDRIIPSVGGINTGIRGVIRSILSQEFAETPMIFIDAALGQSGHRLFSAYRVLEEAQRTFDPAAPPYRRIQKPRTGADYNNEKLLVLMADPAGDRSRIEILEELLAARRIKGKADQKRAEARQAELDEEENTRKSEAEGNMSECGCCMGDYPLNRMIHCDGETIHWFCRGCALKTAETEIENARYELKCMSMDGCSAGFSMEQRSQFLDANTIIALERNEQESNLRLAGIENLASCPFCPYAAEYPPIEINREFECARPECEKVSCRLCKLESHIPKSCEEHAKENGLSIRRQIEEAMSAAMIRKCNKCQTPFIKEEGCNKMTCTRSGCHNIQCYVCSKSCGYEHFNDATRGGKSGNCPLFESAEERHDQEVKEAERLAMEKVRADHPEYTEEDLKVKMSEDVQKDDDRRKANDPQARMLAMRAAHGMRPGFQPPQNVFIAHGHHRRHRRMVVGPAVAGRLPALPVPIAQHQGGPNVFEHDDVNAGNDFDDGDDVLDLLNMRPAVPLPGLANQFQTQQRIVAQMRAQQQLQLQQQVHAKFEAELNGQAQAQLENPQMLPQLHPAPRMFNELAVQQPPTALGRVIFERQVFLRPNKQGLDHPHILPQLPPPPPNAFRQLGGGLFIAEDPVLFDDPDLRRRVQGLDNPNILPHLPPVRNMFREAPGRLSPEELELLRRQEFDRNMQRLREIDGQTAALHERLNELQARNHPNHAAAPPFRAAGKPEIAPPLPPNMDLAGPLNDIQVLQERLNQIHNVGERADRDQRIIDHAERQIHRRQEVARLWREQEDDEAMLARQLAAARQNSAAGRRQRRVKRQGNDEMNLD